MHHAIYTPVKSGFPLKCQDEKSGLFSTRHTKISGRILVSFWASDNKFDNSNG